MDIETANIIARKSAECFKAGRFDESLSLLLKVHAAFPDDKKILYNLAVCFGRMGKIAEGLDIVNQLAGFYPADRLAKLRDSIRASVAPPSSAAFMSSVDLGEEEAPPPGPAASPALGRSGVQEKRQQRTRFSRPAVGMFEPVYTVMIAGNEPGLVSCGYVPLPESGNLAPRTADDPPSMLPPEGWRGFVKLVEHLIEGSPKNMWFGGNDVPPALMRTQMDRFGRVFNAGELTVAVAELKGGMSLLLTDRRLYFCDTVGPKAIPWDRIEASIGPTGEAGNFLEIRLRDATRAHIGLGAAKKLLPALATFLNEISYLYEWEGTSLVIMPLPMTNVVVPSVCCNCVSQEVSRAGGVQVRDPAEPPPEQVQEEEARPSALSRLFSRKEQAEVRPVLGPMTFARCTYCQWEQPVRISTAGDRVRVFVFQNAHYAELFRRSNAQHFTQLGL